MSVALHQSAALPTQSQVDREPYWVVVLPAAAFERQARDLPYGELMTRIYRREPEKTRERRPILFDLPNAAAGRVSLAALPEALQAFDRLTLARQLIEPHRRFEPQALALCVHGFSAAIAEQTAEALLAAVLAAAAVLPSYRSQDPAPRPIERVSLYGCKARHGFKRSYAEAEGNHLARRLTALPGNELTPTLYRKHVAALAKTHGWRMRFLDVQALKRRQAGAFLAVCQGSPEADAGIVHLRYRPPGKGRARALALVGKGICFDTGGVNLKPANFMLGMHKDMQGSAVALGALLALTRLEVDFPIECWLAIATNHIGPRAYKPNDVVRAGDGTTIEVVNTDAEGRMVLADTLVLASQSKPALIIDYATLTGSCKRALGNAYSGVFTNRREWVTTLVDAGRDSGERVWPFPLDADFDEPLESGIADVKQCSEEGPADHILAARFLQRFVKNASPWIHIDLSSGTRKGGLAHVPTDITGFGVRYTTHLLLDKGILEWKLGTGG